MIFKAILWILFGLMIYFIGARIAISVKKFKKAKKTNKKVKALMEIVSVPVIFVGLFAFYSLFSFAYVDFGTQANAIKDYEISNEEYAAPYQVKDYVTEDMNNMYWNKIPASTREVLKNNWTLIYDDTIPSSMRPKFVVGANEYDKTDLTCGGLTYVQKRLVYVNAKLRYDMFQNSYIHEFGHVVSYEYGTLHGSIEWKMLYYKYKDTAPEEVQGYYTSDAAEFFAFSYAAYFQFPEYLQENMPDIYEYMDELNHTELKTDMFSRVVTGMKGILNQFIYYMI